LRFYRLSAELQPDEGDVAELLRDAPAPAVFMLIHYFGYPSASPALLAMLRQAGALVVSDCAHAPLSRTAAGVPLGEIGEVALYSLNKFIPVCDGAILVSMTPRVDVALDEAALPALPAATVEAYEVHLRACRQLFEAPTPAQAEDYLGMIASGYEAYYKFINDDLSPRRQGLESRRIEACFPFAEAARVRRRHGVRVHQALLANPVVRPLWQALPTHVVPFGIPVIVADHRRDDIQRMLFEDGILASTLVDKWDFVAREREDHFAFELAFLRDHLLLPVSEFMSDDDVSRLIGAIQCIH
jgi:dTDP-4-amino-4,6-dideoxygalactose transaminase